MAGGKADKESVEARRQRREREAVLETRGAALRAGAVWAPLGPVLCIATLWLLKESLISANEMVRDKSEYVTEPFMPVVLLAGVGTCYAAFATWRITQSSGAVGGPAILAGIACVLVTLIVCSIAAFVIFSEGVPGLAWIALLVMSALGVGAVCVMSHISG